MTVETSSMIKRGERLHSVGNFLLQYGLVLVIAWIGVMKFTAYEAAGIEPLVRSSPFMSWLYRLLSVQGVSNLFGVIEISIAVLIAMRQVSWKLCAIGSGLAIIMFFSTLSFLFTLPGWEPSLGGFPGLSGSGGFLLKDIILLGSVLWSLSEALGHSK